MRLSKEIQQKNLITIRQLLVRNPDATLRQLHEATKFSEAYIIRLKKKIDRQAIHGYNHNLMRDIAKIENDYKELLKKLWLVIDSKSSTYNEKVAAIRQVKEIDAKLLEAKFNAGLYERKLGTVDVNNMHTFLDMVMASSLSRNAKTNNNGGVGLLSTAASGGPK